MVLSIYLSKVVSIKNSSVSDSKSGNTDSINNIRRRPSSSLPILLNALIIASPNYLVYLTPFDSIYLLRRRLRRLQLPLRPLAKPISKKLKLRPHEDTILDKLLHAVHQPIAIPTRQQPARLVALVRELRIRSRQAGLVGDAEHAHPAPEDPQSVDGVEGLRAAVDLDEGEGAALGRAHAAGGEGDPVDLVFEHAGLLGCLGTIVFFFFFFFFFKKKNNFFFL